MLRTGFAAKGLWTALATVAVLLLFAAACGGGEKAAPAAQPPAPGGTQAAPAPAQPPKPVAPSFPLILRYATNDFGNEKLDPTLTTPIESGGVLGPIWDWITEFTDEKKLQPGAALSWEQSADGLSWTFKLRQGIKFHDGTELTAEDVQFTLMEAFRRPDARSSRAGQFKKDIKNVEVVDRYTVRIVTNAPWATLAHDLSNQPGIEGIVMPKSYIGQVGWDGFPKKPIGSGPWSFVKHDVGSLIEFQAVKDHRTLPKFERLQVLLVTEEATRTAMLKTNQVDIIFSSLDQAPDLQQAGFKILENPEFTTVAVLLFGTYLDAAGPLKDLRVRQALAFSVNREEMIRTIFRGRGKPAVIFPVSPGLLGYPDDLKPYPFDPARAKQLLAEAGVSGGFDFKVLSTQGEAMTRNGEAVANFWRAIGIKASVVPTDIGWLRPRYAREGLAPEIVGNGWIIGTTGRINAANDFTPWWMQSGRLVKMSPDIDDLASQAQRAPTLPEVEQKTKQGYRALYNQYRTIPVAYVNDTLWAYGNRLGQVRVDKPLFRQLQPSLVTAVPAR